MSSQQKLGALAVACLFAVSAVVPAYAQQRGRSGGAHRGGSGSVARGGQGVARPGYGSGSRSGYGSGHRPGYGYGPGYRPGYGSRGHYPYYGHRGYYPYYGYRGYYPWYGYGGYYGGYYPGSYWGVGAYVGPGYYGTWPYAADGYSSDAGYASDSGGAGLKIEVEPKSAEVYVDGYLAGIVDQFDGMFDRLPLDPGEHEVTIYQDGYRSIRQRLNLSPGSTYRVKGKLARLAPGEPNEPRPQASNPPPRTEAQVQLPPQYQPSPQPPPYQAPEPQGPPPGRSPPVNTAPDSYPPLTSDSRFGQVAIRVQPRDAEVFINGEPWRAPAGAERLVVFLSPGTHRIEIRKEGFEPFAAAVEIRRGEQTPLNVSLARF